MEIKSVSIIGLGALGVLFGNHLASRMPKENLRFIADEERIIKYKKDKVYCNGNSCEFNFVTPEEILKPADLLIFAVKYSGLKDAISAVRNHVGENTIIISVLNGITSEAIIGETYGMNKILYCVAQGMDAVKEGNRLTYHNMGVLVIGDGEPGIKSENTMRLEDFFSKMDLPHEVDTSMKKRIFSKFMLNVGVNQTVAVYGSNYSIIHQEGIARDTMIAAMREVMYISEKEGINLTEDDIHYWLDILNKLSPDGKPSMRQDIEAKRHSEVDLFSGTVIEFGKKHGIPTPVNQMLYDKIKEIENTY
ncbi:MAG: hypothetical protein K0R21_61 [Anaerocolumna sp.]|jgi:2-dehydropantoate 2-reductase|nr:hypothetical protein [Anaerocolumna sp.]